MRQQWWQELRVCRRGGRSPSLPEKYVQQWPARAHDHFSDSRRHHTLLGQGQHGSGNQRDAVHFHFQSYGTGGRLGMDGRPRPIHLEHGLRNIQWERTTAWTEANLVNRITPAGARGRMGALSEPGCMNSNSLTCIALGLTGTVFFHDRGDFTRAQSGNGRGSGNRESCQRICACTSALCGDPDRACRGRRMDDPSHRQVAGRRMCDRGGQRAQCRGCKVSRQLLETLYAHMA